MKRIILFIMGCFLCGAMKAQHQELFDEFRQDAGDQAEMFVGKIEPGYPSTVYINDPYWLDNNFTLGDVVFNGLTYKDVSLRYDAYLKQLVVNTPIKNSNVYIPMNSVEKFSLGNAEFERRNGEIMLILFKGSQMELVEWVQIELKEKFVDNVKVRYEFKRDEKYFVLRSGQMFEVNNRNSVLKLFPAFKKELRSFAKMHNLDFKEHRRSSLASMIMYVDELLSNSLN